MTTLEAKQFNETEIIKHLVTDSDGTMFRFVPLEFKHEAGPNAAQIERLRQYSFANPDTNITILSGRTVEELNDFYGDALRPDDRGRIPKIVLAGENGAKLQFSPVVHVQESAIPNDQPNFTSVANPLSETEKEDINALMTRTARNHYTNDSSDTSEEKWVLAEIKTYGVTAHLKEPKEEAQRGKFQEIKRELASAFNEYGKEREMLVHLNAASAFTMERVSKGVTMEMLADNHSKLKRIFRDEGRILGKATTIFYGGDDIGDRAALKVLNDKFSKGELYGFTLRPNNYTTADPVGRISNDPKESAVNDSFYVIGSSEVTAQDQYRSMFTDNDSFVKIAEIRQNLSDRGLMPSQSGKDQTPPIVLLPNRDILIQEPHMYPRESLESLKTWNQGNVVLLATDSQEVNTLKEIAKENQNIVVADHVGNIYARGRNEDSSKNIPMEHFNLEEDLKVAKDDNLLISESVDRAQEIQFLWSLQAVLFTNGILDKGYMDQVAKANISQARDADKGVSGRDLSKLADSPDRRSRSQKKNARKRERKREKKWLRKHGI